MRPGYETGNTPFYMKFPREQYYKDHKCVFKYNSFISIMIIYYLSLKLFLVLKDNIHHFHCTLYKK